MTTEEEILGRVVEILDRLAVPYMVTGSIATSYHGRPRATHDADVVIDPTAAQLDALVAALDRSGFHVHPDGAREALRLRSQFNIIEMTAATKIDLIIRKARAFSIAEFDRRQRVDLPFARGVAVITAEDAIVSKLDWARRTGDGERHIRDAVGVLEINPGIDRSYVAHWAERLGLTDLWERLTRAIP